VLCVVETCVEIDSVVGVYGSVADIHGSFANM